MGSAGGGAKRTTGAYNHPALLCFGT